MRRLIFIILINSSLYISSCQSSDKTTERTQERYIGDSLQITVNTKAKENIEQCDSVCLEDGKYKFTLIQKYLLDSLIPEQKVDFYPLITKQTIKLHIDNKIIYNSDHKVKSVNVKTQRGNVNILSNVIMQIGLIKGRSDMFFCIEGYGGCNTCTEYSEIINSKGQSIFLLYSNYQKTYLSNGNLQEVLKKNGIDQKAYRSGDYLFKRTNPVYK